MKYFKRIQIKYIVLGIFVLLTDHSKANDCFLNDAELKKIQSACIECIDSGVMVCGNKNISITRNFQNNFYQGKPSRGFFISPPFLSSDFKALVRAECNYENLNELIKKRFSKLKLISVNKSFEKIAVFTTPKVVVNIPEKLHSCLMNKNNKWGCGVSKNRELECCEKKLGSPSVVVTWIDKENNENLELHYIPDMGSTKFVRKDSKNKKEIYFCQTSESATLNCRKSE